MTLPVSEAETESVKQKRVKARVSEAEETVYENDPEYDDDEPVCNEMNVVMTLMIR